MADEILLRDQNHVTVLGGVTDDSAEEVTMLRVDPTTKRLLVMSTDPGTSGGQIKITAADTTFGYIGSGKLVAGTNITLTVNNPGGNETLTIDASASNAYNTVENQGVAVTQRTTINLSNLLTATDSGGKTALTINVANLANDNTFTSALNLADIGGAINLSTQVTGLLNASYIDQSSLNLSLIGGLLNLATQVTGTLTVASGGTGATTLSGVLHGNGTSAFTAIALTTDGAILIGDGAGAPTTLNAFSSSTGTLKVANGGTAIASYTTGDIIYASGTTTLAKLADVAVGSYLRSGGLGVAPLWSTVTLPNSATTGDLIQATASNTYTNLAAVATGNVLISGGVATASSWGKVGLTTHVSGILPMANGGTGANLSDPNVDAIYVWDDTTNTTRLANLSGISYNTSTNTLSSSGVNLIGSSYTFQIPLSVFSTSGVTGSNQLWRIVTNGQYYGSYFQAPGTTDNGYLLNGLLLNARLQFNSGKKVSTQFLWQDNNSGVVDTYIGLFANNTAPSSTVNGLFFRWDFTNSLLKAGSYNGSLTEVTITGITSTNPNTYAIVYDPVNTRALFYVNTVLKATITTNLPTAVTDNIGFGYSGRPVFYSAPIFSIEY